MKEIVILSGKGGTGKTFLASNLAVLLESKVIVDTDVDAPNLYLLLRPEIKEKYVFISGKEAKIDKERCNLCGVCRTVCRFEAITENLEIDLISCEGCGVCSLICPEKAIFLEDKVCGEYFISDTFYGEMVHAELFPGEENSGKLVTLLRKLAKDLGEKKGKEYVLIDGPPGIGCPVMASLTGTNLCIGVTEPTYAGFHDLKRLIELCNHFRVPLKVIINKADINPDVTRYIEKSLEKESIEVLAKIPFSEVILESVLAGIPFIEYAKKNETNLKKFEPLLEIFYKIVDHLF